MDIGAKWKKKKRKSWCFSHTGSCLSLRLSDLRVLSVFPRKSFSFALKELTNWVHSTSTELALQLAPVAHVHFLIISLLFNHCTDCFLQPSHWIRWEWFSLAPQIKKNIGNIWLWISQKVLLFKRLRHFGEASGKLLAKRSLTISFCCLRGIRGDGLVRDSEANFSHSVPVFKYFYGCFLVGFQHVARSWIMSKYKWEKDRVKAFIARRWEKIFIQWVISLLFWGMTLDC